MKTLDERALRRPEFADGVPVKLFDGQEWTLPRPTVGGYYPRRKPDGVIEASAGFKFGADYDAMVDAYMDAQGFDLINCLFALASWLLIYNYTIADEDLPMVLYRVLPDDPLAEENTAMWDALADIALGNATAPKATPVGSA